LGLRAPLVEQASGEAASQNLQNSPGNWEQVVTLLEPNRRLRDKQLFYVDQGGAVEGLRDDHRVA